MPDYTALSRRTGIPVPVLQAIASAGRRHAQRVVLYGSRARGDHHPESDIDIAFFGSNEGFFRFETCMEQLPTLLEYDLVHVTEKTSPAFAENIKKDGIVLMDASVVKIQQLHNALSRLEEAIAEYRQTGSTVVRDGAIQRFEFCAELAWKAAQDYMQAQGYLDVHSPKAVMRKAYAEHIITDEAAEFQGGVGTAGSANLGKRYAMFEAIHGSAPRMIAEGRGKYADPCSMLRAAVLLLSHIGYQAEADKLERALDICMYEEKKLAVTGRDTGCTCEEFGNYVMDTIARL